MSWLAPVFDRVPADAVYGNPKGVLDYNVLNRIEGNVQYIVEEFTRRHISFVMPIRQKEVWYREDYIKVGQFNQIKDNVMYLRDTGYINTDAPILPISQKYDGLSTDNINDIERILFDLKQLNDSAIMRARIMGTFVLGGNYQRQYVRAVR